MGVPARSLPPRALVVDFLQEVPPFDVVVQCTLRLAAPIDQPCDHQ